MTTVDKHIALAFPTLIGRFQYSDAEEVNQMLLSQILDRETHYPSRDYANQGGWHSAGDLLDWPGDSIANLRKWITESLSCMVQATYQLPEVQGRSSVPRGGFRISAWANVSRPGSYHRMHNHPGSAWSGVYYVSAEPNAATLSGVLELYDPRSFAEMTEVPGSPYGQRVLIRPLPGLMVLFPGWLYHFVHPLAGNAVRVSIAFNAAWHGLAEE